jgi:signal transduction histidine kinase
VDLLAPFGPAVLAVRWSTTAIAVAVAVGTAGDAGAATLWALALTGLTVMRTATPLRDDGSVRSLAVFGLELALVLAAVISTGSWDSPLVFCLLTTVVVVGFARGFGSALVVALLAAAAVTGPQVDRDLTFDQALPAGQWTTIVLLVAIVAGYARRISGEAARQHTVTLDRLSRLADANSLLYSLHRIAQSLPASLDTEEVLESSMRRLRGLLDFHGAVILLLDDTDGTWMVGRRHGFRVDNPLTTADLPDAAARAAGDLEVKLVEDLSTGGPGFSPGSGTGLYAPLTARGRLVGLLAVEHRDAGAFGRRQVEILQGFVEAVSLAIDNARWFARLRTVSADEERTRIARDLHDRIGQSLAYLAFELDRIVKRAESGEPVDGELTALRADLRGVIGEVRDTLYDLRTDVGDDKDLPAVIAEFTGRVARRSSIDLRLDCGGQGRLPVHQERELWRIAQEAVTNAERHAAARSITVTWRCDGHSALLVVADDGVGFPDGRAGRMDSYGILGMKERASSIGALLEINSQPREGTTVRCYLHQR